MANLAVFASAYFYFYYFTSSNVAIADEKNTQVE